MARRRSHLIEQDLLSQFTGDGWQWVQHNNIPVSSPSMTLSLRVGPEEEQKDQVEVTTCGQDTPRQAQVAVTANMVSPLPRPSLPLKSATK